jgi:hypothetical protein
MVCLRFELDAMVKAYHFERRPRRLV